MAMNSENQIRHNTNPEAKASPSTRPALRHHQKLCVKPKGVYPRRGVKRVGLVQAQHDYSFRRARHCTSIVLDGHGTEVS